MQVVSSSCAPGLLKTCDVSAVRVRVSPFRAGATGGKGTAKNRTCVKCFKTGWFCCFFSGLHVIYKRQEDGAGLVGVLERKRKMPRVGKKGTNPGGTLSTQEAARVLGVSPPTLLKLMRIKRIPEPQVFRRVRYWNNSDLRHARMVLEEMAARGEIRLPRGGRG